MPHCGYSCGGFLVRVISKDRSGLVRILTATLDHGGGAFICPSHWPLNFQIRRASTSLLANGNSEKLTISLLHPSDVLASLLASPQLPSSRKSHRRTSRGILVALGIRLVQLPSLPGSRLAGLMGGGWDLNLLVPRGQRGKDRCAGLASFILAHGLAARQPDRPGRPRANHSAQLWTRRAVKRRSVPKVLGHISTGYGAVFMSSGASSCCPSRTRPVGTHPPCRSLGRVGKVSSWQDRMFETL